MLNVPLRDKWGQLFGLDSQAWPTYRDWPRLPWLARRLLRWSSDDRLDKLSPYLLASEARALADAHAPGFALAGASLPSAASAPGEQFWPVFVDAVERALITVTTDQA